MFQDGEPAVAEKTTKLRECEMQVSTKIEGKWERRSDWRNYPLELYAAAVYS